MRISLIVTGSRGDVQPFIALGRTLTDRGHVVTLATHADFEALVTEGGLGFVALPGSPQDFLAHPALVEALTQGASLFRAASKVPRQSSEHVQELAEKMLRACDGADLIVNSTLSRIVFDDNAVSAPWASLTWYPLNPTSRWPAMMTPQVQLGPLYNRLSHRVAGLMEWYIVQDYRKRAKLPPLKFGAPYANLGHDIPLLCAVSRTMFTEPPEWPARSHITGYWFWDRAWTPPPGLADFMEADVPPVTLTFGSIWPVHAPTDNLEKVLTVVRRHGRRLVMVGGPEDTPDDVFRIDDALYPWLFQRSAAVIHHGGCNTTGEALRSGTPQVVVPTFADSPLWAARVHSLGVAAKPIPYSKFTAERLDEALSVALNDKNVRQKAASVGEAVRAERGTEAASEILEEWAKH
jgi:O-mycaminosyltylonolide 6-deoxyallosyltransferase